jgi:hypothetical protein
MRVFIQHNIRWLIDQLFLVARTGIQSKPKQQLKPKADLVSIQE